MAARCAMTIDERIKEARAIANTDDRLTRLRAIVVDAALAMTVASLANYDAYDDLSLACTALRIEIARSVPRYDEKE